MALPMTTTHVTIEHTPVGEDPWSDTTTPETTTHIPGVISGSTGTGLDVGGAQQILTATLFVEQDVDLSMADVITDESTGEVWRVLWVRTRYELGLGHRVAGLEQVQGATSG